MLLSIMFVWLIAVGFCTDIKQTNLIFIKIPKCSSTTSSGVARRIAYYNNLSDWDKDLSMTVDGKGTNHGKMPMVFINASHEPGVFANHMERSHVQPYIEKLRLPAFVFTTVRDPARLAISHFYYFHQFKPWSEDLLMKFLKQRSNSMYDYMKVSNGDSVDDVIMAYDFIGASELYNYSSVLLSHALKVPIRQVLHLDGKVRSANDGRGTVNVSEAVVRYLEEQFPKHNKLDYELYEKVTNNLRREINPSNRGLKRELDVNLAMYNKLQSKANEICKGYTMKDCYWHDNGCGRACLDSL
jgi:hypothetical protein